MCPLTNGLASCRRYHFVPETIDLICSKKSISGCPLTDDGGLQVDKDGSGDVLPCCCLTEEGAEGIISPTRGLVTGHLAVRLDPMLQAIQLPACIAHLGSGLADMDGNALTLKREKERLKQRQRGRKVKVMEPRRST